MPFLSQLAVRRVGVNRWELTEDLCYRDDRGPVPGRVFTAPAGYRTDFATRPRLVGWLFPRTGRHDEPTVPHDLGCDALRDQWEGERRNRERALYGLSPLPVRQPWLNSRGVDQLWHRSLLDVGIGRGLALVLWAAVRWGALFSAHRRRGWLHWRETPLVLAVTAVLGFASYGAVRLLDFAAHALL